MQANRISKSKGIRHLFEILREIKDNIVKKRYNLAWELASKHYEQNRNSLTNEEIYQLCWQSCIAIEKKIYHRLTAKHKRNIAPVAHCTHIIIKAHIQHVLSLELCLHAILLPEVVLLDKGHFNMLYNQSQSLDPKVVSEEQLIFERKNQNNFLASETAQKQLKRIVKHHLKICNAVLMYKVAKKKCIEDVTEVIGMIQGIFEGVKQHDFPSEVMDFELIKLSIIEEFGSRQGIKCQYRLPLGFLKRIYQRLSKRKEEYLDHYLKKLTSYFVLSFRHLNVSIEEVYVGCCEAKFIAKLAHTICLPSSKTILQSRRKTNKPMHRTITLDSDNVEEVHSRFSKLGPHAIIDTVTTDKKIDSKKKVTNKGENKLRQCAEQVLKVIEDHIQGRKELSEIILKYFNLSEIKRKQDSNPLKEDFIEKPVRLNEQIRSRKKASDHHEDEVQLRTITQKDKDSLLATMLARPKNRAKSSGFDLDDKEPNLLKMPAASKSKAKFILKNIQMVKKSTQSSEQGLKKQQRLNKIIEKIEEQQRKHIWIIEYSQDSEDQCLFEKQRKKRIEEYKNKLATAQSQKHGARHSSILTDRRDMDYPTHGPNEESEGQICMLDEVVSTIIKQRLLGTEITNVSPLKRLQSLKRSVESLNTQRKLIVESLTIRQNASDKFIKENIRSFSHYNESVKEQDKEHINEIVDAFRARVNQHVTKTRKLANLQQSKDAFLPKKPQKDGKLKISEYKKSSKKLSELTFEKIEEAYKYVEGKQDSSENDNEMALRYQFDQLRRDVSKNQFLTQAEKKNSVQKRKSIFPNIPTIVELTRQDETNRG